MLRKTTRYCKSAFKREIMRNTVYVTVILVLLFILHNVKSRKHAKINEEFKTNSKTTNPVDQFNFSKYVDKLISGAETIDQGMKTGKRRRTKTIQKKKTDDEDESNYDSLGLDEKTKDQIVRSNTGDLSFKEMKQIFRARNAALAHKKKGRYIRSGGGLSLKKEQEHKALRSIDRPTKEESSELRFDLEEHEEGNALRDPFF